MDFRSEMLAARVRRYRLERKLSIEQLAKSAGVDKNTIVRLEKGEGRPNLSTLMSICGSLEVSADTLMDMKTIEKEDFYVYRRDDGKVTDEGEPGLKLGDLKGRLPWGKMNAVVLHVEGEGRMRSHPGEEITFCLKGRLGVMIGSTPVELEKGESIMFYGRKPHKYYNATREGDKSSESVALTVWVDEGIDPESSYLSAYHIS